MRDLLPNGPTPADFDDIKLARWVIFESMGMRHIFGMTREGQYFTSSPILEETSAWIRTRSRRYWKGESDLLEDFGLNDQLQLEAALHSWRLDQEEVIRILDQLHAVADRRYHSKGEDEEGDT